jgi:branched-chain amino acid aminotransferase
MDPIPFDKRSGKIWYNGKLVEWQDANLHILSHGLHYASCVFEGERVYSGKIFKLREHTDRLIYSAQRMGITVPYSADQLDSACNEIISAQKIVNGYVRPIIWRGSEMMAISAQKNKIHVAIATWEWPSYFDPQIKMKGIRLGMAKWRKPSPDSIPWDTKASGLYMISTLSKHEAEKNGYHDALMLDYQGNIAEATGANIFFVDETENEIHTPVPDSFLDGITRRSIIDIAKKLQIKVIERKINPNEIKKFKGCFLTGTAAEVTPVSQIEDVKFQVLEIIKKLDDNYSTLVNK